MTRSISTTSSTDPLPAFVLAVLLLMVGIWVGWIAIEQRKLAPSTFIPPEALAPSKFSRMQDGRVTRTNTPSQDNLGWETLTTPQKLVLYPLAPRWAMLSTEQKRRWLVLANNFAQMPVQEQSKLHSRMLEWAGLSAQQRNQARINFSQTNRLPIAEKRAQWETYQSLSEEQKKELAAQAGPKPRGAATALKPSTNKALVQIPAAAVVGSQKPNLPKIPPPNTKKPPVISPTASPSTPASSAPDLTHQRIDNQHMTEDMKNHTSQPTMVITAPISIPSAVGSELPALTPLPQSPSPHPSENTTSTDAH